MAWAAGGARAHHAERGTAQVVAQGDRRRGRVGHHQRDAQRPDGLGPAVAQDVVGVLDRVDPADAGADDAPDPLGVVGRLVGVPARLGDRLGGRDAGELGPAVGAARLLDREVLGRVVGVAAPRAVLDAAGACAPALVERAGADAQRRDGAQPGDDYFAHDARSGRLRDDQVDHLADGLEARRRRGP